jgi:hypothetical protein
MNSLHGTPENVQGTPLTKMGSTPTTMGRQTAVKVKTLTTSSHYPKAELILNQILKYEHQKATVRSQGTQTTQSKLTGLKNLPSEAV